MAAIVRYVIVALIDSGQLELVRGADTDAVVAEVLVEIAGASGFSQAGSTIAAALVRCPLVEEVYADDNEILSVMNHVDG